MKGDQRVPHGVVLEFLVGAEDWSPAVFVGHEDVDQTVAELVGDLRQGQFGTGSGRVFDAVVVTGATTAG